MLESKIEEFKTVVSESKNKIHEAANIYVSALDSEECRGECENITKEFAEKTGLSFASLALFEKIGRNQFDYRLLFMKNSIAKALSRMPYSIQKKVLDEKHISVYIPQMNDVMRVHYENLTKEQIKMIFTKETMRDLAGQKNFWMNEQNRIDSQIDTLESLSRGNSYEITRGRFHCKRNTSFTKSQMAKIVCRMYGVEHLSEITEEE